MSNERIELKDVEPAGYRDTTALICCRGGHSEMKVVRMPYYEKTSEALRLRELRDAQGLVLRKAAQRCGLTASQYTGVEEGSLVPARVKDWSSLFSKIEDKNGIHGSNGR